MLDVVRIVGLLVAASACLGRSCWGLTSVARPSAVNGWVSLFPSGGASAHPAPASPATPTLRSLREDRDHRIALFGSVLIGVWIRTEVEALRAMERFVDQAAAAAPHGRLALFVVVEPHAIAPSAPAREELSRIRRASRIGLTALVYEGDGFGAAVVRGITTSLNLLEGGKTHTQIFADVPSAARWIRTSAPEYGGGEALEAAVRELRAHSR
jgi:hypothetical protein